MPYGDQSYITDGNAVRVRVRGKADEYLCKCTSLSLSLTMLDCPCDEQHARVYRAPPPQELRHVARAPPMCPHIRVSLPMRPIQGPDRRHSVRYNRARQAVPEQLAYLRRRRRRFLNVFRDFTCCWVVAAAEADAARDGSGLGRLLKAWRGSTGAYAR